VAGGEYSIRHGHALELKGRKQIWKQQGQFSTTGNAMYVASADEW
jgi:hypothetical protein